MVLYRTILPVSNVNEAVSFYQQLFDSPGERVSPGRHYFNAGGVVLAIYDPTADGDRMAEGWTFHEKQYLYFAVANLEAMYDRAQRAGGRVTEPIASMPWGERIFYALDPSGAPIAFVDETTAFRGGGFFE